MKKIGKTIARELIVQIMISLILIVIFAFVIWKVQLADNVIRIMVLIIYAVSSFVGGMIMGKVMEHRRIIWGALAGIIYIGMILMVALAVKGNIDTSTIGVASGILTSVIAGAIGGILG